MKVYAQLLQKGITTPEDLHRALSSAKRIKDEILRDEVEWEITLNFSANRGFI